MSEALVTLNGLQKVFPKADKPALTEVTAKLWPGRITGLVGPDGAGKTTLIRLMAGLLVPTAGTVTINGLNPINDAGQLKALIGYMPQKFGLYEDLTVQENLNLHADLRNVVGETRTQIFTQLLNFTDLNAFTTRLAGKLSGGMKPVPCSDNLAYYCSMNPVLELTPSHGVNYGKWFMN